MSVDELVNSFYTGTSIQATTQNGKINAYRYDGLKTDPGRVHKPKETDKNDFYLYNINPNFDLDVTMRFTISNTVARYLHVAVFVDGKLEGLVGYNDKVHYGPIVGGQEITDTIFVNQALTYNSGTQAADAYSPVYHEYGAPITSDFSFLVSSYREVEFVVWFDGMNIVDSHALHSGSLMSISFLGDYVEKA